MPDCLEESHARNIFHGQYLSLVIKRSLSLCLAWVVEKIVPQNGELGLQGPKFGLTFGRLFSKLGGERIGTIVVEKGGLLTSSR